MAKISRFGTRIRQTLRSDSSSFPYLSGDTFKLAADFQFIDIKDFHRRQNWSEFKVVFCKSESLDLFLSEKPSGLNPSVLLCGNSDFDFHSIDEFNFDKIKAVFLQNSFVSDNKRIFTLPIGLENASYESNGRIGLFSKRLSLQKSNSILVGPFGNTHGERSVFRDLPADPSLYCVKDRVSTRQHLKNIDSHRFVACPRGNGVDTHRLWETLYRGSIPVLLRNSWSESLQNFGLPVQIVEEWSDLCSVTSRFITLSPDQIRNNPLLWMQNWEKMFSAFI
jgi:hypothetical protein